MIDGIVHFETSDEKFSLVFNFNVMDKIQTEYGSIKKWQELVIPPSPNENQKLSKLLISSSPNGSQKLSQLAVSSSLNENQKLSQLAISSSLDENQKLSKLAVSSSPGQNLSHEASQKQIEQIGSKRTIVVA